MSGSMLCALFLLPCAVCFALWGVSERRRNRGLPSSGWITLASLGSFVGSIAIAIALLTSVP